MSIIALLCLIAAVVYLLAGDGRADQSGRTIRS